MVIGTDPFRVLRVVCARMRLCKVRCTHASNVSPSVFVGVRVSLCLPAFTPMPRMHSAQLRLSGSFYCPRRSNGRKPCLVQVFLPLSLSLSFTASAWYCVLSCMWRHFTHTFTECPLMARCPRIFQHNFVPHLHLPCAACNWWGRRRNEDGWWKWRRWWGRR